MRRTASAGVGIAASALISLGALAWSTDGFRALTYEGARTASIAAAPRPIPATRALAPDGRSVSLLAPGTVYLVDFVSTSCTTLCVAQGVAFAALQDSLREREATGARAPVRLLTVSFDPDDHDTRLAGYAALRGADDRWWQVRAVSPENRRALLDTFGVVVVRDPIAGWRHNAAFHVVDANGTLVRIVPSEAPGEALRHAMAVAEAARR